MGFNSGFKGLITYCEVIFKSIHCRRRVSPVWTIQMSWWWNLHLHPVPVRRGAGLSRWLRRRFSTLHSR